jgi:hypothetical protein
MAKIGSIFPIPASAATFDATTTIISGVETAPRRAAHEEHPMDFNKPIKAPGTRTRPPRLDIPGVDDADSGAGAFWVWDNILPESPGSAKNTPNPMTVQAPGIDTSTSLASKLCWRTHSW